MFNSFPIHRQLDLMDCAPTCLMMVCQYFGRKLPLNQLREICDKGTQGVTLFGIHKAAEEIGLRSSAHKMSVDLFLEKAKLPCIVHWKQNHFVVVFKTTKNKVYIADPEQGKLRVNKEEFIDFWTFDGKHGFALFLETRERFFQIEDEAVVSNNGLKRLTQHLFRHKKLLAQIAIGAILGSVLNLIFPFLTQSIVDQGIGNRDIGFIYAILLAQLMLFLGRTVIEFIRGWILVHVGTRVNVAVISDFLMKLMQLPLNYFERRNMGDVLQRVADHQKIEEFLTSHSINIIFSFVNLIVFAIIMGFYSSHILFIFVLGSVLSVVWTLLFLNKRKIVDYKLFQHMTLNQNKIIQMVEGMSEIKMNQGEIRRRREWEDIQGKLFNVKLKALAIDQYQQAGNLFFNESKNIFITFVAAYLVINGDITLGMMMAITYILGQMNAPIEQFITFVRLAQDAKISMDRLGEIQEMKDEKPMGSSDFVENIPEGDIQLSQVSFKYGRHDKSLVLANIDLTIPQKKMTAIVGASGSGKTTLMKLLLGIHKPLEGSIQIGSVPSSMIEPEKWREISGVVLQEGFLFSDSIANNIAMTHGKVDFKRIFHAAKTANIHHEIERLPQGYMTNIGPEGVGLSGGQKQRILIARAIYKNPEYLFFDEATSALDANNERVIQDNLMYFLRGRTSVVIAHRLSTVKNADQIIVLDEGKVVETGDHATLTQNKGTYFHLVRNQLELGA